MKYFSHDCSRRNDVISALILDSFLYWRGLYLNLNINTKEILICMLFLTIRTTEKEAEVFLPPRLQNGCETTKFGYAFQIDE